MDTLASIELFPVINAQPAGTQYNPALPIQRWQVSQKLPASGKYAYAYLDPATGSLAFTTIPAAQANQANIPDSGQPSVSQSQNTAINQPPVDLSKYNALAGEGEQIVATPFGLMVEALNAPAASPAPSSDSPLVQQIASDVAAIRAKLGA